MFFVLGVAFLVLLERFLLGTLQSRTGPFLAGAFSLLQTIIDSGKLFFKGFFGVLVFCFLFFVFYLFGQLEDLFLLFFVLSFCSYMMSFINFFGFSFLSFISFFRSNVMGICFDVVFCFLGFLGFFFSYGGVFWLGLFFVFCLMEIGRTPFDLNEGESELVSSYNTEYSSIGFTFLFLGEYLGLILVSVLFSFLFYLSFLPFISFLVLVRGVLPRLKFFGVVQMSFSVMNLLTFLLLVF